MASVESSPNPKADLLDQQPQEIAERASDVGRERLDRSNADIFITGAIGGLEVSLGGLAAMTVVGSALEAWPGIHLYGALALGGLVFPIGFLFVIIGRSELYTENFLIPVVSVFKGERSIVSLLQLWGFSWLGNVLACAVMAAIFSIPDAIGHPILTGYGAYADYKLSMTSLGLFWSAVLAGATMTMLTWLMLAIKDTVGKILAIWAAGYVLFATNLSHAIVGAALLFVGFHISHHTFWQALGWLALATFGNLIGGVGLVTLFRLAQAKEKARQGSDE